MASVGHVGVTFLHPMQVPADCFTSAIVLVLMYTSVPSNYVTTYEVHTPYPTWSLGLLSITREANNDVAAKYRSCILLSIRDTDYKLHTLKY